MPRNRNVKPIKGTASWTYSPDVEAWYVALSERAKPPYLRQAEVRAILDLDASGRLAGIEIIDRVDGKGIELPKAALPEVNDA